MFCRCLAILIGLLVSSTSSCLRAQAIRQEEDKPLLPPSLMFAGEPSGGGNILIGFTIASLRSIPFSGTVEAESQIVDAQGNDTFHRLPLFPWRKSAMCYEDKTLPQAMPGKRRAPVILEPDHLGDANRN